MLLGLSGKFVHRVAAFLIHPLPVRHQVREPDASMAAELMKRNFTRLQLLYKIGTRDIEHVGRLLCGEFRVYRHQRYGVALRHLVQDVHKHMNRRDGHGHISLAVNEA